MSLADLPPLREVVAEYGLGARKSLGQHFLFDLNLTAKAVRVAGDLKRACVIEVGPGPGGLTRAILDTDVARLIVIEKDTRFLPALQDIGAAADGRLTIINEDALKADERALAEAQASGAPVHVIANLPYNVGTNLLVKWLTGPIWWAGLTLMFQKEVAQRITATTGEKAYGRLAVLAELRARPSLAFEVPARAFTPPPKVDSAVVTLTPREAPYPNPDALGAVTAAAFGQRRKMLRASLKSLAGPRAETLIEAANLNGQARPEEIEPEGFARMADAWARMSG